MRLDSPWFRFGSGELPPRAVRDLVLRVRVGRGATGDALEVVGAGIPQGGVARVAVVPPFDEVGPRRLRFASGTKRTPPTPDVSSIGSETGSDRFRHRDHRAADLPGVSWSGRRILPRWSGPSSGTLDARPPPIHGGVGAGSTAGRQPPRRPPRCEEVGSVRTGAGRRRGQRWLRSPSESGQGSR